VQQNKTYDRGSPIVIEVEVYVYTPFEDETLTDPDTIVVSVGQSNKSKEVVEQAMTKYTTGKYYYIVQTTSSWEVGTYNVEVKATSGSYSDTEVAYNLFTLV
jgi:hypothetical protein